MKIYSVSFNDGGWHESRQVYMEVAENRNDAIEQVLVKHPYYRTGYDKMASEFKIEGYVIEVYDEKSYNRDKNIEKIL
jgi:excinuclease UvrABC helicase subunit UvrB